MKKALVVMVIAALAALLAGSALAGDSAKQLLDKGAAALTAGDDDGAIVFLTQAIESKGLAYRDRAKVYHWRGRAFESKGYWGDALNDYRRALWLDKENELYLQDVWRVRKKGSVAP